MPPREHSRNESLTSTSSDFYRDPGRIIEDAVGMFGKWQCMICTLVFLMNTPLVFQQLNLVFTAATLNVECSEPTMDACDPNCPKHIFDHTIFKETIRSEFDLTCNKAWLADLSQTFLMLGILFGNVCFGAAADKYGRRKPLVCGVILEFFFGIAIAFMPEFWSYCVFRFLVAVAAGGTLLTAFSMVVEVTGRKYRSILGILFQMPYYIGHSLIGVLAYFIRHWRYLQFVLSLPVIVLASYYWLIPESPRWLLTVGYKEEAIAVLEKGARFNKMPTEHIREEVMTRHGRESTVQDNFIDLFKSPNIRCKTLCVWFNWFVCGISFFGVAQYMGSINGNIFVNVILSGLIQIPANLLIIVLLQKLGRKITLILMYCICGVCMLLTMAIPLKYEWIITMLGCLSMMGISTSFATMYIFSGEIFPTAVRTTGLGTSAMCAKFGAMTAPFLNYAAEIHRNVPPLIFGVMPLIAVLVSLRLPETLDKKMPDTVEEAELFGKKES